MTTAARIAELEAQLADVRAALRAGYSGRALMADGRSITRHSIAELRSEESRLATALRRATMGHGFARRTVIARGWPPARTAGAPSRATPATPAGAVGTATSIYRYDESIALSMPPISGSRTRAGAWSQRLASASMPGGILAATPLWEDLYGELILDVDISDEYDVSIEVARAWTTPATRQTQTRSAQTYISRARAMAVRLSDYDWRGEIELGPADQGTVTQALLDQAHTMTVTVSMRRVGGGAFAVSDASLTGGRFQVYQMTPLVSAPPEADA